MKKLKSFPFYKQADTKDCGPTCLKIIAKHFGKALDIKNLRFVSETTREGTSLLLLSGAAEKNGFRSLGVKISFEKLCKAPLPCILHWNSNHFVVLYKIDKKKIYISDPACGLIEYTKEEFLRYWIGGDATETTKEGIALLLEPTPLFYENETEDKQSGKGLTLSFLSGYILKYKLFLTQLIIGLLAGSIIQLIFPFLTQSIVDTGIRNQNIHFVNIILIAQLFLFIGRTVLETIRSWIFLHLSTRVNIALISDFFIKLMNLPISFLMFA